MEKGLCDMTIPKKLKKGRKPPPPPKVKKSKGLSYTEINQKCRTREGVQLAAKCKPKYSQYSDLAKTRKCWLECKCHGVLSGWHDCAKDFAACLGGKSPHDPAAKKIPDYRFCKKQFGKCKKKCNKPYLKCVKRKLWKVEGSLFACIMRHTKCIKRFQDETQNRLFVRLLESKHPDDKKPATAGGKPSSKSSDKTHTREAPAEEAEEAQEESVEFSSGRNAVLSRLRRDMITTIDKNGNVQVDAPDPDYDPTDGDANHEHGKEEQSEESADGTLSPENASEQVGVNSDKAIDYSKEAPLPSLAERVPHYAKAIDDDDPGTWE